jgi:maltose-binding protein MalE
MSSSRRSGPSGGGTTRRAIVKWALSAGSAVGAALLGACGAPGGDTASKSAAPVSLTFMNRGGREAFAVHDKVVAAFVEKTPNVKVTTEPVVEGTWNAKLTTLIAGNTAPDTVMCAFGDFLPFCKRGDLVELDSFLGKDKEVKTADWFPLALDSMRYKGKIFNMPYNGGTYAVFYNRGSSTAPRPGTPTTPGPGRSTSRPPPSSPPTPGASTPTKPASTAAASPSTAPTTPKTSPAGGTGSGRTGRTSTPTATKKSTSATPR